MEITLPIERLGAGEDGIGHAPDGKTVFVPLTCPGDTVEAEITQVGKRFDRAVLTRVLEPGPARVTPACPHYGVCGGCGWQHIDYAATLEAKRTIVVDALTRIGGIKIVGAMSSSPANCGHSVGDGVRSARKTVQWTVFSEEGACPHIAPTTNSGIAPTGLSRPFGYRNKIELEAGVVAGRFTLGFHRRGSYEVVSIDSCPLLDERARGVIKALRGALSYVSGKHDLGIKRVGIRCAHNTSDLEICLYTTPGAFPRAMAAKTIGTAIKGANGIVRALLKEKNGVRGVSSVEVLRGKGFWRERLNNTEFLVSAPSFFQVNTEGAEVLTQLVCDFLAPDGSDAVLDLYAGVGTFSVPLARTAGQVSAIESYGPAVRDLRRNADATGIDIDVIGGDAAREIALVPHCDLAVVDPPRAGLDGAVVDALLHRRPRKIAYVSCDPATLARDVALFRRGGYTVSGVKPVDLFPQTHHIESVALLERTD
jgi:23S rRNA (uracil1939-C5)-methyltransferase